MHRQRTLITTLLALAVLSLTACGEDPDEAYHRMVFNAKMGNEEAFLEGFTKDSRRLVKTLIALRRTYGNQVAKDADPYLSIILEEVESVETSEEEFTEGASLDKVERKVATLTVTDGKIKRKIVMIEYDDGWKIDAGRLQEFWSKDRKNFIERN